MSLEEILVQLKHKPDTLAVDKKPGFRYFDVNSFSYVRVLGRCLEVIGQLWVLVFTAHLVSQWGLLLLTTAEARLASNLQ